MREKWQNLCPAEESAEYSCVDWQDRDIFEYHNKNSFISLSEGQQRMDQYAIVPEWRTFSPYRRTKDAFIF
jgi:hypothetical protein